MESDMFITVPKEGTDIESVRYFVTRRCKAKRCFTVPNPDDKTRYKFKVVGIPTKEDRLSIIKMFPKCTEDIYEEES